MKSFIKLKWRYQDHGKKISCIFFSKWSYKGTGRKISGGDRNIINTFVKQYDLSGKKIVLFATSGGSNIGKTAEKLKPYLSAGAEIAGAEVLNQNPSLEELKQWAVW